MFPGSHGHVVLGAIGLSETFSYAALGVINKVILSEETNNMFLHLFLTLAGCSLLALPITAAVSSCDKQRENISKPAGVSEVTSSSAHAQIREQGAEIENIV